jgi:hypothetical protein
VSDRSRSQKPTTCLGPETCRSVGPVVPPGLPRSRSPDRRPCLPPCRGRRVGVAGVVARRVAPRREELRFLPAIFVVLVHIAGETVLRSDDESSSIPFRGKIASKAAVFSYALRVSFSGDQETCLRSMVSTASSAAYGYNFASRFKQRQLMPRFSADPSEVAFLQRRQQHAFLQLLIHSPVWDRRGGGQGLRPCSTGTCSLPQTKSPPERCSMDRPKN